MAEIKLLPTKELRPDKNQPRQYKDKDKIHALSVSIKNRGVINPIEVDGNLVIITGEMRWRGALEAGLPEVPCKVLDISDNDRFLRQVHENIHQRTNMTVWDTGVALKRCHDILFPGEGVNATRLAREFGIPRRTCQDYLSIFNRSQEIRAFARSPHGSISYVGLLENMPVEYRPYIMGLIRQGMSRNVVQMISKKLKEAHRSGNEDACKGIMGISFKGMSVVKSATELEKIAPMPLASLEEASKEIQDTIIKLVLLLEKYPASLFRGIGGVVVAPYVVQLGNEMQKYLSNGTLDESVKQSLEQTKQIHG